MKFKIVNFQAHRISGWFFDPEAVETKPVLDLFVDGEPASALACNIYRDELSEAEFPTRNVGFLGALPPQYWTGDRYSVELKHRDTGKVLAEAEWTSKAAYLAEGYDIAGEVELTSRGQLGGWVSEHGRPASVSVFVDGRQIFESRADGRRLAWKDRVLGVTVPPGFAFSFQVPAEFFDGLKHEVQVIAGSDALSILERTVVLDPGHQQTAAHEEERLLSGQSDWARLWKKTPRVRQEVSVSGSLLTSSYAKVSLSGEATHSRVVLRLGERVMVLHALEAPQSESDPQSYAAQLPLGALPPGSLQLHTSGAALSETYDLRLGDESGTRPSGLPPSLSENSSGELHLSPVSMDAACLEGWAFHSGDLHASVLITLREVTDQGPRDLARIPADVPSKRLRKAYGISGGNYRVPMPSEVLVRRRSHLQLVASSLLGEEVLWEDSSFFASNQFLLSQAMGTSSRKKARSLLSRARAAGRKNFAEAYLATHRYGQADLQLEDLEGALAKAGGHQAEELEPASGAVWYWVHEIRTNSGRLQWFTQNAIRNKLSDARDVLAYCMSKGRYDFDQVHGLLESARTDLFRKTAVSRLESDYWRGGTLALARFLYCSPRDEIDYLDALSIYALLEEWHGVEVIKGADRAYYGDLLMWRGRPEEAARVLRTEDSNFEHDYSQNLLALNSENPNLGETASAPGDWLDRFNTLLEQGGAASIASDAEELSFYTLASGMKGDKEYVKDGPLVSVIVPVYEPSEATNVAIASLLGQTWANLEILIVDDCSPSVDEDGNPTPYREQLENYAKADARIRLSFSEVNRGSYSVRNQALDMAAGEFVTVADKDDWHHPQQIELQVRQLMEQPDLVANITNWVRVDEKLKFLLRSATGRVVYPSMPSLMFRREPVLRDIGYWDAVRKSGDSEFKSRLENFYGISLEPVIEAPLAFALMEDANLTRDDMGVGYLAPERRAYLRAYKRWHREIREEDAPAYMPKHPEKRRIVAPSAYLPERVKGVKPEYDVVFASEFGFVAGNSTSLFNEISVCLNAGLRVGVIPFQNGLIPSAAKRQFNRKIDDLVLSGQVDRLSLDTEAETDLLVIRWPTAVQMVRDEKALLEAKRAVVVSNHPPYEPSGARRSYDIGVVTRNVESLFGTRPTWAPQSEQIGAMLQPLLPASDMEDYSWKGIIQLKDQVERNRFRGGRPVIGRHARDDAAKWPSDREVFRKVYPVDGSADVCILGGAKVPTQQGFLPQNSRGWEVFVFNEIEVEEYLSEKIDFFVYFHSDGWLEAFGMAILEAMSYGVVCVLPKHFQPVFKDAAVYAEPGEVQDVIASLWSEDRYKAQQLKAAEFIERECTPEAYLRRLARLGVEVSA